MSNAFSRRRFLLAALASALAASGCRMTGDLTTARRPLPDWLSGLDLDPAAAARLGQVYLAAYPEENDAQGLLDALVQAVGGGETFAALDRAVRAEYARGEFVQVNGWILSRSEARLYALIAVSG